MRIMTTLYLIRHGETTWNADGRFQGHSNSPLNDVGRAQAVLVARAFDDVAFHAVYASDLERAADTASEIARRHELLINTDARLREASFGEWEGLTLEEVSARWPDVVAAWRADSLHTRAPGGETLEQVQARVLLALQDIRSQHPDGDVAIVGHGGSVRAIIAHVLNADLSIFRRLRIDNCSINIVQITPERSSLIRLNDICHLHSQTPRSTWDEAGGQRVPAR